MAQTLSMLKYLLTSVIISTTTQLTKISYMLQILRVIIQYIQKDFIESTSLNKNNEATFLKIHVFVDE